MDRIRNPGTSTRLLKSCRSKPDGIQRGRIDGIVVLAALLLVAPVVKVQQLLVELDGRRVLEQLGDGVQLVLGLLVHPVAAAAVAPATAAVGVVVGWLPWFSGLLLRLLDRSGQARADFA